MDAFIAISFLLFFRDKENVHFYSRNEFLGILINKSMNSQSLILDSAFSRRWKLVEKYRVIIEIASVRGLLATSVPNLLEMYEVSRRVSKMYTCSTWTNTPSSFACKLFARPSYARHARQPKCNTCLLPSRHGSNVVSPFPRRK